MTDDVIAIEEFAAQTRTWLAEHMPPAPRVTGSFVLTSTNPPEELQLARFEKCRELQRRLFEGGYAGITVPQQYGGQGLTPAHQAAFNRELVGYDYPAEIQASTFIPCMALLLEFGTEEQKQRHIPAILRGEEIWVQLLSEPGGGSDTAGAVTSAVRDGDGWVINGSKMWTTDARHGDWAMCLARTNWDVEKHRGLTVFSFPLTTPGVDIRPIELVNGSTEFCQEFLTDVVVADRDRVGEINAGWDVVTRWLYHERTISGGSPYVTGRGNRPHDGPYDATEMIATARELGTLADPRTRALIGEAHTLSLVMKALAESVTQKMAVGALPAHAAAMMRLFSGTMNTRRAAIGLELAGSQAAAWQVGDDTFAQLGSGYLIRQVSCIGGGTTEMARNVISERLLGMPREHRNDAGPFRDVPRSPKAAATR